MYDRRAVLFVEEDYSYKLIYKEDKNSRANQLLESIRYAGQMTEEQFNSILDIVDENIPSTDHFCGHFGLHTCYDGDGGTYYLSTNDDFVYFSHRCALMNFLKDEFDALRAPLPHSCEADPPVANDTAIDYYYYDKSIGLTQRLTINQEGSWSLLREYDEGFDASNAVNCSGTLTEKQLETWTDDLGSKMYRSTCYESKETCDNEQGGSIYLQDDPDGYEGYYYSKFNCLWIDERLDSTYLGEGSSEAVTSIERLFRTLASRCEE